MRIPERPYAQLAGRRREAPAARRSQAFEALGHSSGQIFQAALVLQDQLDHNYLVEAQNEYSRAMTDYGLQAKQERRARRPAGLPGITRPGMVRRTPERTRCASSMNNTPYVNLWYTRAALDYLVLFHIKEMLSPGTLARSERKIKDEYNQTYLNIGGFEMTPSKVVKRGEGFK